MSVLELRLLHPGPEHLPPHHSLLPQLPWTATQPLSPGCDKRPPDTWIGPILVRHLDPGSTSLELCPILPTSPDLSASPHEVLGWTGWGKRPLSSCKLDTQEHPPCQAGCGAKVASGLLRGLGPPQRLRLHPPNACPLQALSTATQWLSP